MLRQHHQRGSTDAIVSVLIFLDLLRSDAQHVAKVFLGPAGDLAHGAQLLTHLLVQLYNVAHPTELAMLRGARLVAASETEEGRAWAEARIKQMTGGDPITARFMRQDFFTYTPTFKLTIVGNHAPALVNVDDAARRRFNVVPFVHKPATPDRALERKLETEWPGILRWMIEGAVAWRDGGLARPASVVAATADYFDEQDLTARWLAEACEVRADDAYVWETSADLFASWAAYAKAGGEEPGTSKSMAARLRRHGLRQAWKSVNGRSARCWTGVRIVREGVPYGHD